MFYSNLFCRRCGAQRNCQQSDCKESDAALPSPLCNLPQQIAAAARIDDVHRIARAASLSEFDLRTTPHGSALRRCAVQISRSHAQYFLNSNYRDRRRVGDLGKHGHCRLKLTKSTVLSQTIATELWIAKFTATRRRH